MIYMIAGLGVTMLLGLLSYYLVKYGKTKEKLKTLETYQKETRDVRDKIKHIGDNVDSMSDDELLDKLRDLSSDD